MSVGWSQTRRSGDEPQALTGAAWWDICSCTYGDADSPSAGETRSFFCAEARGTGELYIEKARQRGERSAMTQNDDMADAGGLLTCSRAPTNSRRSLANAMDHLRGDLLAVRVHLLTGGRLARLARP